MKNHALYTVFFKDGSHFIGGNNYFDTKWLEIPDKKINRVFYRLPDGDYLCLPNYDEYYHMVEATKDWMRIRKKQQILLNKKPVIEYVYIMGKKKNKVTSYRITLFDKLDSRYKLGDITRREYNIKDEKIMGLNPEGWK